MIIIKIFIRCKILSIRTIRHAIHCKRILLLCQFYFIYMMYFGVFIYDWPTDTALSAVNLLVEQRPFVRHWWADFFFIDCYHMVWTNGPSTAAAFWPCWTSCRHGTAIAQLAVSIQACGLAINTRCLRYLLSSIAQYNNVNVPPYCAKSGHLLIMRIDPVLSFFVRFSFFLVPTTLPVMYVWICPSGFNEMVKREMLLAHPIVE